MSLRPYKFVVQAVVQDCGKDGNVLFEQTTEPVILFGCDALAKWASAFTVKLAEAEKAPSTG